MPLYPGVTCSGRAIRFVCFHSPSVDFAPDVPLSLSPFLLPFILIPVYSSSIPSIHYCCLASKYKQGWIRRGYGTYIHQLWSADLMRSAVQVGSGPRTVLRLLWRIVCMHQVNRFFRVMDGPLCARLCGSHHCLCSICGVTAPMCVYHSTPYLSTCMHRSPSS